MLTSIRKSVVREAMTRKAVVPSPDTNGRSQRKIEFSVDFDIEERVKSHRRMCSDSFRILFLLTSGNQRFPKS